MQKWLIDLLVKALQDERLIDLLLKTLQDERVKTWIDERFDKMRKSLMQDVVGLLPTFGTSIIKAAFDKVPSLPNLPNVAEIIPDVAQNIVDADPDIPGLSDIIDLSEILKPWLPR